MPFVMLPRWPSRIGSAGSCVAIAVAALAACSPREPPPRAEPRTTWTVAAAGAARAAAIEVAAGLGSDCFAAAPLIEGAGTIDVDAGGRVHVLDGSAREVVAVRDDDRDGVADRAGVVRRARCAAGARRQGAVEVDPHGFVVLPEGRHRRAVRGPDARVWFTVDAGTRIVTREGVVLELPDTGAVLRCEPDGSALEIFAIGLCVPSGVAFDAAGEAFVADAGGTAGGRILHVVGSGDYGWRDRASTGFEARAPRDPRALPAAGVFEQRVGGLAFHPGTGFAREQARCFAAAGESGVLSFALAARGATCEVDALRTLARGLDAADVTVGPRGIVWVVDRRNDGAIRRLWSAVPGDVDVDDAVVGLLASDVARHGDTQLLALLDHPDLRVRTRAHVALAARGPAAHAALSRVLAQSGSVRSRRHALWSVAIAARHGAGRGPLVDALGDDDAGVRAIAARVCGELRHAPAVPGLRELLRWGTGAERREAMLAVGRIGARAAAGDVFAALSEDTEEADPFCRHAGAEALAVLLCDEELAELAGHAGAGSRVAVVLALWRNASPRAVAFLDDPDEEVRHVAAWALRETATGMPLTRLADRLLAGDDPALLPHAIAAARLAGRVVDAERLLACATAPAMPAARRVQALRAIASWGRTSAADPVTGRDLPAHPVEVARDALEDRRASLGTDPDFAVRAAFVAAVRALHARAAAADVRRIAVDRGTRRELRARALAAWIELDADRDAPVAVEAVAGAPDAPPLLVVRLSLAADDVAVQQAALEELGSSGARVVEPLLLEALERLDAVPIALWLELLDASAARRGPALRDALVGTARRLREAPLGEWRVAVAGGDAEQGAVVHAQQCAVCHAAGGSAVQLGDLLASRDTVMLTRRVLEHPRPLPAPLASADHRAVRDLVAFLATLR